MIGLYAHPPTPARTTETHHAHRTRWFVGAHRAGVQTCLPGRSAVTRMAYRDGLLPHGTPVWQRNYWDRVIRDDGEYQRIADYIRDNPANWKGDRFNR
ncbi:MAG: hypothetical protein IPJ10_13595 [Flavobacteriales bacterium]|nr:hypothetical protein [Flavobacteriales bacterium]